MPNEYQDPKLSPDSVHISTYATDKDSKYVVEKREFNRFQDDEVPTRAKHRSEKHTSSSPIEHEEGGKCWTEQPFEFFDYITRFFIKKRWVEYWQVNTTLKIYYETVSDIGQNAEDLANKGAGVIKEIAKAGGLKPGTSDGAPTIGTVAGLVIAGAKAVAPLAEGSIPAAAGTLEAGAITAAPAVAAIGNAAATLASEVLVPAAAISATLVVSFVGTTKVMEKLNPSAEKISEGWELVSEYYGPEELEKTGLGVDHIDHPCPKKAVKFQWPGYYWWLFGGVLILIALISFFLGVFSSGLLNRPTQAVATEAPATLAPATAVPPTVAVVTEVQPTVVPTVVYTLPPTLAPTIPVTYLILSNLTLSGFYNTTITVATDPAGHSKYILMPATEELRVEIGTITVSGPAPWVTVTGNLNSDGSFNITGTGTVAGYPNIKVQLVGTLDQANGLVGDYTMGVGGGLPTNQSITYHLTGNRVKALATNTIMQTFLTQLASALSTNDTAFLFNNLHPAAITAYGAATCQAHFQQRSPDPTYKVVFNSMTGPAAWTYAPPGLATVSVPDVYTVSASVTAQGQTAPASLHIGQVDDRLYWFTTCK